MTAENESIFNEVDHWANEKSRRAKPTEAPDIPILPLNGYDHKAVTYTSSRALNESKSDDD
jgi:hypothetical protein